MRGVLKATCVVLILVVCLAAVLQIILEFPSVDPVSIHTAGTFINVDEPVALKNSIQLSGTPASVHWTKRSLKVSTVVALSIVTLVIVGIVLFVIYERQGATVEENAEKPAANDEKAVLVVDAPLSNTSKGIIISIIVIVLLILAAILIKCCASRSSRNIKSSSGARQAARFNPNHIADAKPKLSTRTVYGADGNSIVTAPVIPGSTVTIGSFLENAIEVEKDIVFFDKSGDTIDMDMAASLATLDIYAVPVAVTVDGAEQRHSRTAIAKIRGTGTEMSEHIGQNTLKDRHHSGLRANFPHFAWEMNHVRRREQPGFLLILPIF